MKGIINIMELILVLTILFIAFSILLPGFSYRGKWSTAYLLLTGRDLIITIDRLNALYTYSFNPSSLNAFITLVIPANKTNIIWWPEAEGTFKSEIYVGCNCTQEQFRKLTEWFANLRINSRSIHLIPCYTNLDKINLCRPNNNYPDVLLIWGYKDLSAYNDVLKNYLSKENGIVEIMDFETVDETQKSIFGIDAGTGWTTVSYDTILKPNNVTNMAYQPYKTFYHIPKFLETTAFGEFTGCTKNVTGNFTLWDTKYLFTICNYSKVFFDSNADNSLDTGPLVEGNKFSLNKINIPTGSYNFTLDYIISDSIRVSFLPTYNFTDFCKVDSPKKRIVPTNIEDKRVFMSGVDGETVQGYCSILNGTFARTVWIADFSRNGLDKVGDDHVQMLISLLLWASNKRSVSMASSSIRTGFLSTYINTVNYDMFEVYKFKLGLGYPY
jgi:hypothetical protein